MLESLNNLNVRLREMPRAIQWAVWAAIAITAFLIWDVTIGSLSRSWSAKADAIEAKVERVRAAGDLDDGFRRLRSAVQTIGPVDIPKGEKESKAAINQAINEILAQHRVSNTSLDLRTRGFLKRGTLTSITKKSNERIAQLIGDLRFEADVETTIDVLRALESNPEIESVESIRIVKQGNQSVTVRLEIEAWVKTSDTGSRRGART